MKKILFLTFVFIFFVAFQANALETTAKSIAVFPVDIQTQGSNYSIYPMTTNLFCADLVNELKVYNDFQPIDLSIKDEIIKESGLTTKYQGLIKEYKNTRTIDYSKLEEIANVLGTQYVIFAHGGFDLQRSAMKPNMFFKLQYIWAPSVTPSTRYDINLILVDVKKHRYMLEKSYKHNFKMDDFLMPSQQFGENVSTLAQIKKFTKPITKLYAGKVYAALYAQGVKKYSDKTVQAENLTVSTTKSQNGYYNQTEVPAPNEAFVPINNEYNNYDYNNSMQNSDISEAPVRSQENIRKEYYKNWIEGNN